MDQIDVGLIFQSQHARPIDKANVDRLAGSIEDVGLIHAISVRRTVRHRGTTPFDAYEIVSGHHRYAAALQLKWRTIRCDVVTLEGLKAELAEIDENLVRANYTPAQESAAIVRRKVIYEEIHPETKHGSNQHTRGVAESATPPERFTVATAKATGKAERTIREAAARGKALGDDLGDIVGTSLDKGSELDALSKMLPEQRSSLIARAKAGERVTARSIKEVPGAKDAEEIEAEQKRGLMNAWNKAAEPVRQWFRDEVVDAPLMDARYGSAA